MASTDGGTSWSAIATGQTSGPHHDHHALGFDFNAKLLDANDGGIWRLEDFASPTWANLNGDLGITQFVGLALHPTNPNLVYGGTQDTGVLRFNDSLQWKRPLRGDGGAVAVNDFHPERVYAIRPLSEDDPHFFVRSNTGGDSWVITMPDLMMGIDTTEPRNFYPPLVLQSNSNIARDRLLLGTNHVYETVSAGTNGWVAIGGIIAGVDNGWTSNDPIDSLAAASDGNTIYAATGGHQATSVAHLFVTTNDGTNWQQRDIDGAADHINQIVVDPTTSTTAYAVRDRFGGGHVFRTTNSGVTWTDISGDLPDLPTHTIAVDARFSPQIVYVGTDSGVYFTMNPDDLVVHWSLFKTGLPSVQVTDLKLGRPTLLENGKNILAAATHGRGVWEILIDPPAGPSHAPANGPLLPQSKWESTPSLREQKAPAVSVSDAQPGFAGQYALDTLFAAHQKDNHHLDLEGRDAFTQDLALIPPLLNTRRDAVAGSLTTMPPASPLSSPEGSSVKTVDEDSGSASLRSEWGAMGYSGSAQVDWHSAAFRGAAPASTFDQRAASLAVLDAAFADLATV